MKEVVKLLATLFAVSPDAVKAAIENDDNADIKQLVSAFEEGSTVFTAADLATKINNAGKAFVDNIVDNKLEVPQNLYNMVKGTIIEMFEKEARKTEGFEVSGDGIESLVKDIVKAGVESVDVESGDAALEAKIVEKDAKIKTLQDNIEKMETEHETAIGKANTESEDYIVNDHIEKAVNSLLFDVPEDKKEEATKDMREMVKTHFNNNFAVSRKDGKVVATNKGTGKVAVDNLDNPLDLAAVVRDNLPSYVKLKDSPKGGRGSSSSEEDTETGYGTIKTMEDFAELAEKEGIDHVNSKEGAELLAKVRKENPEFKIA